MKRHLQTLRRHTHTLRDSLWLVCVSVWECLFIMKSCKPLKAVFNLRLSFPSLFLCDFPNINKKTNENRTQGKEVEDKEKMKSRRL